MSRWAIREVQAAIDAVKAGDAPVPLDEAFDALRKKYTPEKILDWVDHLCSKTWMTTGLIQRFVEVACGAHDIKYQDIT